MELTSKEAFRLGFLARCAEEGLTGPELQSRIKLAAEKQALGYLEGTLLAGQLGRGAANSLYDIARSGATLLLGAPLAGGLAAGGLGGYALAKFNEPNVSDDDVKAQEISDTYRRYAQRMKIRRKLNPSYRQAR